MWGAACTGKRGGKGAPGEATDGTPHHCRYSQPPSWKLVMGDLPPNVTFAMVGALVMLSCTCQSGSRQNQAWTERPAERRQVSGQVSKGFLDMALDMVLDMALDMALDMF